MKPSESSAAIERYIRESIGTLESVSLPEAVETVLQFYADCRASDLASEDGDMLLFQYGCYDWGDGEHFEFDITRQFIVADGDDDDAISQLHVTFYFVPDAELRGLPAFNLWCHSPDGLIGLKDVIRSNQALALASIRRPVKVEIGWEPV